MAHNLIAVNGKIEMAYTGDTPWHRLGQVLTKGASLEEWKRQAGFEWQALEAIPQYQCVQDKKGYLRPMSDRKVLYRSDNGAPLGIVSDDYQVVQPDEAMEFFRDICESNGWYIHTAGMILGGKKLWVMASRDQSAKIGAKDLINHNILLATSLDGSMRTVVKDTPVRVVCNNTFTMALGGKGREIQVSHRTVFDAEAVKRKFNLAGDAFEKFMAKACELAETPIAYEDGRDLLMSVFAKDQEKRKAALDLSWMNTLTPEPLVYEKEDPKDPRSVTRCLDLFSGEGIGSGFKTSKGTKWGLFNAVTQHVDHELGRSDDTRMDSAWFGRGDGFKTEAWNLLTADQAVATA